MSPQVVVEPNEARAAAALRRMTEDETSRRLGLVDHLARHARSGQSPDESRTARRQPGWQRPQTDRPAKSYRHPSRAERGRDKVGRVHVVINHLRLRNPVSDATVQAAREGMQLVVDAGALAARVAKVDETHLILILEFATAEDADRVARDVGGPWMREHIRPLLAGDTERSVGEVIASAEA